MKEVRKLLYFWAGVVNMERRPTAIGSTRRLGTGGTNISWLSATANKP